MFHAWLVKIANTAASSTPRIWPGNRPMNAVTVKVRNPRIGTDCRMSSIGTMICPARRLRAANVATTSVKTKLAASAANIRITVRSA